MCSCMPVSAADLLKHWVTAFLSLGGPVLQLSSPAPPVASRAQPLLVSAPTCKRKHVNTPVKADECILCVRLFGWLFFSSLSVSTFGINPILYRGEHQQEERHHNNMFLGVCLQTRFSVTSYFLCRPGVRKPSHRYRRLPAELHFCPQTQHETSFTILSKYLLVILD